MSWNSRAITGKHERTVSQNADTPAEKAAVIQRLGALWLNNDISLGELVGPYAKMQDFDLISYLENLYEN